MVWHAKFKMADAKQSKNIANYDAQKPVYYILLNDRMAAKREKVYSSYASSDKKFVSMIKGEILKNDHLDDQAEEKALLRLSPIERPSLTLQCSKTEVKRLDKNEACLLLALPSLGERLRVLKDRNLLELGKKLDVGSKVWVKVSVRGQTVKKEFEGVIRYKGLLPGLPGIMFGVELVDGAGKGSTDGTFKGKQYFECDKDAGLFVSIEKLAGRKSSESATNDRSDAENKSSSLDGITSRVKNRIVQGLSSLTSSKPQSDKSNSISVRSNNENCLDKHMGHKLDDLVWVYIKEKPQQGIVKYIGREPGGKVILAGIHMDSPCGMGDGNYHGKQLFSCPFNHAHFAPIENVISTEKFAQMQLEPKDVEVPKNKNLPQSEAASTCNDIVQMESNFAKKSEKDVIKEQEELFRKAKAESLVKKEKEERTRSEETDTVDLKSWDLIPGNNGKDFVPDDTCKEHSPSRNRNFARHVPSNLDNSPFLRDNSKTERNSGAVTKSEPDSRRGSRNSDTNVNQHNSGNSGDAGSSLNNELEIGSMVEVLSKNASPKYGVIRWIGRLPGNPKTVAGLELEEEMDACSDGTFLSHRYFSCPPRRGFFVHLRNCRPDSRFSRSGNSLVRPERRLTGTDFGSYESPIIDDRFIPPPDSLAVYTGERPRGIQGHHNSCYLDATLFAAFAFSFVMDSVLLRQKRKDDIEQYDEVQHVLRDQIVYPLRDNGFVRADRVFELRKLLDKLGTVTGLVGEEKDPEEFLLTLLQQVLKSEPFLKIKSGKEVRNEYFYQVLADKDVERVLPSVEELLKRSFHQSNLKLAEVPSCLIVQMPRFGKGFKMYKRILPSLTINIGELVEGALQDCAVCGRLATLHCKSCFSVTGFVENDCSGNFCTDCNDRIHSHARRSSHNYKPLVIPRSVTTEIGKKPIEHQEMELFAIVCIETSHYVTFAKCQDPQGVTRWCFFDSMADRVGSKNGYNIPCVTEYPEIIEWLSSEKHNRERIINTDDKDMPDKVRRILGDAYMCLYQSAEMSMYK